MASDGPGHAVQGTPHSGDIPETGPLILLLSCNEVEQTLETGHSEKYGASGIDDGFLWEALRKCGADFSRVAWTEPSLLESLTSRSQTQAHTLVVCRTTWDYCDSPSMLQKFCNLMDALADLPYTTVLNPVPLLLWNTHKRYLAQLHTADVNVIPTKVLEPGEGAPATVESLLSDMHAPDGLIVKPAVSNSACGVFLVEDPSDTQTTSLVDAYLSAAHSGSGTSALKQGVGPGQWSGEAEVLLAQPFQSGIREWGELSVLILGGQVTHAVVKRPRSDDAREFKVQEEYGGREELVALPEATQSLAMHVLAVAHALAQGTPAEVARGSTSCEGVAIARVDFVCTGADLHPDNLALMEVECVEPSLFLKYKPEAAQVLASYLVQALDKLRV